MTKHHLNGWCFRKFVGFIGFTSGVYADVGKGQKGGAVYKTMDEVDLGSWGAGQWPNSPL